MRILFRRFVCCLCWGALLGSAQEIDTAIYQSDRPSYSVLDHVDDPLERQVISSIFATTTPSERLGRAEEFLAKYPESWHLARVYEVAARAAIQAKDYSKALKYGEEALRYFPENALLLVPIAMLQQASGRSDQAVQSARSALASLDRFDRPSVIPQAEWKSLEARLRDSSQAILRKARSSGQEPAEKEKEITALSPAASSAEYAGSESCKGCHADEHKAWTHTGMAKMFRPYRPENVIGDFGSQEFDEFGAIVRPIQEKDRHFFELLGSDGELRRMAVDYTIGSKWQQAYATRLPNGRIHVFPIQYNGVHKKWVNYWREIDPPSSKRADIHSFHEYNNSTNYQLNCAPCHTSQLRLSGTLLERPEAMTFAEPGINCEMCHGPSGQHVEAFTAGNRYEKSPSQPPVDFNNITHHEFIGICSQCHMQSAMFTRGMNGELNYSGDPIFFFQKARSRPFNEFSKKAFYKDGRFRETTFIVESLLRSKCYEVGKVHCGHCHNPHSEDAETNPKSLKFRDDPNQQCLQCHSTMAQSVETHTRHPAESAGSRCTSCHMPAIMNSLLFRAGTHKIDDIPQSEPTSRFGRTESPNACLLCHTDRDVAWLEEKLGERSKSTGPRTEGVTAPALASLLSEVRIETLVSDIDRATSPDIFASLVASNRWTELARHTEALLQDDPQNATLYYWLGIAQSQMDVVKSVLAFREAEKLGLNTSALHKALGLAYYNIHQYNLFLNQMEKAKEIDPSDPEPYHYIGRHYESETNNFPKALSYFSQAVARDPGDAESLYFRAYCLQMLGRQEEAKTGYRAAMTLIEAKSQKYGWPHQKLAELLMQQDPQTALRYAKKAVELEPDISLHRLVLAKVYERLQMLEEAVAEREIAAKLKPADPAIRYQLFRLYRKLGKKQEAADALKMHERLRAVYGSQD